MTTGAALIWSPFADEQSALAAIDALLDEGLIACGNVLPAVTSRFTWNGAKETSREAGALIKTTAAMLDRATARLAELHPYDTAAIVGWRCDAAAPATLDWLAAAAPG